MGVERGGLEQQCGWGFALYANGQPEIWENPVMELCGPTTLSDIDPLYVGAVRLSNNTAELQAPLEAMLWLLAQLDSHQPVVQRSAQIQMTFDSLYVVKLLLGELRPVRNLALIATLLTVWAQCCDCFAMGRPQWRKAHRGDVGNERADRLAKRGGKACDALCRITRRPYPVAWDDAQYQQRLAGMDLPEEEKQLGGRPFGPQGGSISRTPFGIEGAEVPSDERDAAGLSRPSRAGELIYIGPTMQEILVIVKETSEKWGAPRRRPVPRLPDTHPLLKDLKIVTNLRYSTTEPRLVYFYSAAAHVIKNQINRANYTIRCEDALRRGRSETAGRRNRTWRRALLDEQGNKVTDKEELQALATKYYENLYVDTSSPSSSSKVVPSWIARKWTSEECEPWLKYVTPYRLRTLVMRLKTGKTCSRDDMITAEMIQELPEEVFDDISELFKMRMRNVADDDAFTTYEIALLEKVVNPRRMREWRPISVISVMAKLYSLALAVVGGLADQTISEYQFAFRTGYQAAEVQFVLRQLIEKAIEFNRDLYLLDGDVYKAYDCVDHAAWARAFETRGVPRFVTAAYIREVRRSRGVVKLPGMPAGDIIKRTRSMFQGDPQAPQNFNFMLDTEVIVPFVRHAEAQGWGAELSHEDLAVLDACVDNQPIKKAKAQTERLPILVFADNFWLLASSRRQLQAMFNKLCELLARAGLSIDISECSWSSTCRNPPPMELTVPNRWPAILSTPTNDETIRVPFKTRDTAIKGLGSQIACSGDCTAEVDHRIARAWAAFHKHSKLLLCRSASIFRRLERLRSFVLPALLYNIGTCRLTKKHLSRLRGVELKMMRRILGYRLTHTITPQQDAADYMAISAARIGQYRSRASWHRWGEEALLKTHRWAGHVARITARAPARLVGKALLSRGSRYLQRMTQLYGYQGHPQRFRVWRWEQLFSRRRGPDWLQDARQGELWEDCEASWLVRTQALYEQTKTE